MFVQTEETPNQNALKFIPGNIPISKDKSIDFPNIESTNNVSNLAKKLFEINGVTRVFFGNNFITITKQNDIEWIVMKPHIFATIVEYMTNGWPIFANEDRKINNDINEIQKETNPKLQSILDNKPDYNNTVIKEILALIEERIRPAVSMDGGDINFVNFVDGTVYVEMLGACSGCSSAGITLKNGVETLLKHYIPEVKNVEAL